ncbi:MAG: hypothetical protein IJ301_02270 [Clostridia bacterium]|nr:hypothetical protein [Clostridia bacterium]
MTTQKAQSKIKSSTIAITILSVLLAVAVAATIVLAAFSASKQATTTITFGGGIAISVSGIYINGEADSASNTQATGYAWGVNGDKTGTLNNVATDAVWEAISITNEAEEAIYLIAKASITEQTITPKTGWVAFGSNGWYLYGTNATTATSVAADAAAVPFVDAYTIAATNDNTGKSFTGTFDVYAVNAAASDALATLQTKAGVAA